MPQIVVAVGVLVALSACFPGVAAAHGGLAPSQVLGWWTFEPVVLALLAVTSFLYARGVRAMWRSAGRGHGVRWWQAAAYALGVLATAAALFSPLDRLSDISFAAHMSQHEVLMLVAAPLIVIGKPLVPFLWALPVAWRRHVAAFARASTVRSLWRTITGPLLIVVVHGLVLWVWHVPAFFEAALRDEGVHAVQHTTFFVTAALFWWALIHGRYSPVGYGAAVLFVFATGLHSALLGALLTVARVVWYPMYGAHARTWGFDALEDQQLAGLIMWVPAGVVFLVVGLALFAAWLGEAEKRMAGSPYDPITQGRRDGSA